MADPIYTSASPIAVNPANGELIGGATFTVHAPDDTSFSTPLPVTDPNTGVAINPLRSNSNGTLPSFKVAGDLPRVKLKSGAFVTELVSLDGLVLAQIHAAGLDSETVTAAITAAGVATTKAGEASTFAGNAADSATLAEQKASAVAQVVATNDGIMTTVLGQEGSAFGKLMKATYAQVTSIRQFMQEGETLGGATEGNTAAIFQRAIDALHDAYVADGKLRIIFAPNDTYYLAVTLLWKNGVGLMGASQEGTILYAPAGVGTGGRGSAIWSGASPTDQRTDTHFETFTIDGIRQAPTAYRTQYKGLEFEYAKRCRLKHVTVRNTAATAMAFDNPVDVILDHPVMINFGRQIGVLGLDPEQTSGCSGLGNGVGEYDVESITVISPWIDGGTSGLNGIFFERPIYDAISAGGHQGRGIVVTGAVVQNCYVGYRESGAIGAMVDGQFINNRINGVRIDSTNLTYRGGEQALFRGVVKGNGSAPFARSAGVWIGAGGDHSIIDGDISENHGPGVATAPAALLGGSTLGAGIQIRANVHDNDAEGVLIQSPGSGPSGEVVGFKVLGDVYCNHGAGVKVTVPTDMLTVKGWVGDDKPAPTQTTGLALLGAGKTASRVNVTAALVGNTQPLQIEQTVSGNLAPVGTNLTKASALRVVSAATSTGGKVTLAWAQPYDIPAGSAITDYTIRYRKVGSAGWSTFAHAASTDKTIEVTGLDNRFAYEFAVAAVIDGVAAVDAAFSSTVSATPTTIPRYSDTFLRGVSAAGLGNTDGGSQAAKAWTYLDLKIAGTLVGPNTWGIHSNPQSPPIVQARSNTAIAANKGATAAAIDVGAAGGVHEVTLAAFTAPSQPAVGLGFRIQDNENYWWVSLRKWGSATAVYALHRVSAGGNPLVALDLGIIPKKGDVIKVRDKTTSIEVWINGVLAGTYSGSAVGDFATATKAGPVANFADSVTGFTQWSYAIS